MRRSWLGIPLTLLLIAGCTRSERPPASLASQITAAHRGELLHSPQCIAAVVHLELPRSTPRFFDARFTHDLRDGRIRMLLPDDAVIVWDGRQAWTAPNSVTAGNARGKLTIWPFLVTFPLKLNADARLTEPQPTRMAGADYLLTEWNTGGEDRFTLYLDPSSKLVRHLVIPARLAADIDPSFDHPIAISFYNYQSIEGVQFPETWRLWAWNKEDGIHGGPLANVRLYNVEFITPKAGVFAAPLGARPLR